MCVDLVNHRKRKKITIKITDEGSWEHEYAIIICYFKINYKVNLQITAFILPAVNTSATMNVTVRNLIKLNTAFLN